MKRLIIFLVFFIPFSLSAGDASGFIGTWIAETVEALQIVQVYTDGEDLFSNAYQKRDDFIEDPLRYVEFDFVDEDLLYITRADGSRLRGFYQIRENSAINKEEFPFYLYLEDKYANIYIFPVKELDDGQYLINYTLELTLRDQLLQIICIARLTRENL